MWTVTLYHIRCNYTSGACVLQFCGRFLQPLLVEQKQKRSRTSDKNECIYFLRTWSRPTRGLTYYLSTFSLIRTNLLSSFGSSTFHRETEKKNKNVVWDRPVLELSCQEHIDDEQTVSEETSGVGHQDTCIQTAVTRAWVINKNTSHYQNLSYWRGWGDMKCAW